MDEEKYQALFDSKSMGTATWLAQRVQKNVDGQWNDSVRAMGFPKFKAKFSNGVWNIMEGVVEENVDLIRTIPQKHFAMIRTAVTNSLRSGSDLEALTKRLVKIKGITARRAQFIARDQLNKATQSIVREREQENGITKGKWVHSLARSHPRKSHLAAGKKGLIFELKRGAYIRDDNTGQYRYQFPGQEPNCGCTHRAVIMLGDEEY